MHMFNNIQQKNDEKTAIYQEKSEAFPRRINEIESDEKNKISLIRNSEISALANSSLYVSDASDDYILQRVNTFGNNNDSSFEGSERNGSASREKKPIFEEEEKKKYLKLL